MNYKSIFKVISFNAIFFLLLLFFFEFLFTTYKATKFYQQKLIKNNRNLFHDLKSIQANKEAVVPIYPYFLLRENMFSEIKIKI